MPKFKVEFEMEAESAWWAENKLKAALRLATEMAGEKVVSASKIFDIREALRAHDLWESIKSITVNEIVPGSQAQTGAPVGEMAVFCVSRRTDYQMPFGYKQVYSGHIQPGDLYYSEGESAPAWTIVLARGYMDGDPVKKALCVIRKEDADDGC